MKGRSSSPLFFLGMGMVALSLVLPFSSPIQAQDTDTPTPTYTPPPPTNTPYSRPQMMLDAYYINVSAVRYGEEFKVTIRLQNAGRTPAYNIQVSFTSADLIMLDNGGVIAIGNLDGGGKTTFEQKMTAAMPLYGLNRLAVEMTVNYYDRDGSPFGEKFTLYFPVLASGGYTSAATPTPTTVRQARLVILRYQTDMDPLQPGSLFTLRMTVKNVGDAPAQRVTMIVGGGSAGGGSGTPQASGISAGGGEFTNFAPVGSSNVQLLGNMSPQGTLEAAQQLIVNVTTNPGAYPMRITFSYLDAGGNVINDEQVITLLVASLPVVDIGFYQPLAPWLAGQPNLLPLQVINLGKRTAVLGKLRVETGDDVTVENGEMLVGSLDPGGYFTMDAFVSPMSAGILNLRVLIEYTDDFNQPRTIEKTLSIEVMEAPPDVGPGMGEIPPEGETPPIGQETFWQKIWRFLLGLFGLDSSPRVNEAIPTEPSAPSIEEEVIIPVGGKR